MLSTQRQLNLLQDIAEYTDSALTYVDMVEKSKEKFLNDEVIQYAAKYILIIIGEAMGHLQDDTDFFEKYPDLPYWESRGMRNILVHGYKKINLNMLWKTLSVDIPELRSKVVKILDGELKPKRQAHTQTPNLKDDLKTAKDAARALGRRESHRPPSQEHPSR